MKWLLLNQFFTTMEYKDLEESNLALVVSSELQLVTVLVSVMDSSRIMSLADQTRSSFSLIEVGKVL